MAKPPLRNVGASVRQRLLNRRRRLRHSPHTVCLGAVALPPDPEPHADRFVLKGAMLLTTWLADAFRQTSAIDLLGFGSAAPNVMPHAERARGLATNSA